MEVTLNMTLKLTIDEGRMAEIALSGVKSINEAAEAMAWAVSTQNPAIKRIEWAVDQTQGRGTIEGAKAAPANGSRKGPAPWSKRRQGVGTLIDVIPTVMPVGREMGNGEIMEALWASGYKTPTGTKQALKLSLNATLGTTESRTRMNIKRVGKGRYVRTK